MCAMTMTLLSRERECVFTRKDNGNSEVEDSARGRRWGQIASPYLLSGWSDECVAQPRARQSCFQWLSLSGKLKAWPHKADIEKNFFAVSWM